MSVHTRIIPQDPDNASLFVVLEGYFCYHSPVQKDSRDIEGIFSANTHVERPGNLCGLSKISLL